MPYDLKKLAQLVAVADAGSISRAAERLHITQPALSRNIASLEKQLGVRVFERGRGGATLTEAGALAVDTARSLLRQSDALEHNLRLHRQGDAGKVVFGMGPMIGSLILPALFADFLRARPALHLRSVIKSSRELMQELLNDRLELFFSGREDLPATSSIALEPVVRLPIAYVVRAHHPLLKQKSVRREQMLAYPLLAGTELPHSYSEGGQLTCDNYHILRETVTTSDGVWITSPKMIRDELRSGQLQVLDVPDVPGAGATEICAVHRKGYRISPGAERVLGYVRNFLRE